MIKRCKDCGAILEKDGQLIKGYGGEEITSKLFPFKKVWVYRCLPCRNKNFIAMVNSDIRLKAKYYGIHGKTVEEVIK